MEKAPQAISFDVVGTFLHFAKPVAETYDYCGPFLWRMPNALHTECYRCVSDWC